MPPYRLFVLHANTILAQRPKKQKSTKNSKEIFELFINKLVFSESVSKDEVEILTISSLDASLERNLLWII